MYYDQRLRPASERSSKEDAIAAKVRQVRLNLADPTLALVPVAGGHGAFGKGMQVMKARNAGEAKWAKRQASNFKEIRVRENHKTRIGYVHNNQKRTSLSCHQLKPADIQTSEIRYVSFSGHVCCRR